MRGHALAGVAILMSLAAALAARGLQAEPGAPSDAAPAAEQCQSNFAREGSFFKGTIYRSHASFPGVSRDAVFEKAAQSLAADGWRITGTNKDLGLITAIQPSADEGRDSPLNTVVKQQGTDTVKVEMSLSLGAMMKVPDDLARGNLCKVFNGIAQRLGGARPEPASSPRAAAEAPPIVEPSHLEESSRRATTVVTEAPAPQAAPQKEASAAEQCRSNVVKEGSFLKGTTYRGFADFPGLSREAVLEGAARSLAADGWQITDTNEDAGSITAIQQPEVGGRDFTLKTVLKSRGADTIRVEMSFSVGALMKVPDGSARDRLCGLLSGLLSGILSGLLSGSPSGIPSGIRPQ